MTSRNLFSPTSPIPVPRKTNRLLAARASSLFSPFFSSFSFFLSFSFLRNPITTGRVQGNGLSTGQSDRRDGSVYFLFCFSIDEQSGLFGQPSLSVVVVASLNSFSFLSSSVVVIAWKSSVYFSPDRCEQVANWTSENKRIKEKGKNLITATLWRQSSYVCGGRSINLVRRCTPPVSFRCSCALFLTPKRDDP